MRCPNCGNENPPDYVFCDECGARLQEGEGTENSPTIPSEDASTPPTDEGTDAVDAAQSPGIQPISSMVVTPRQDDDATDSASETEPVALSTPVSDESTAPTEDDAQDNADVPVTEDTVSATSSDDTDMTGDGSGLSAEPMPDVVEIDSTDGGSSDMGISEAPMNAPDMSPAASGTPAVASDGASVGWASTALTHLDEAQQAMAKGDYVGYGQSLGNLRSLLESVAAGTMSGGASDGMATEAGSGTDDSGMAPTPMGQAQSTSGNAASSADSLGSFPMVEPAAEAGTLTAEPGPETAQGDMTPTVTTAAEPGGGELSAVARLVVISTGAELPLPDQEEISVGREDPSSGIFPDVDLTPYGGEEGGVSRRHARLLHIGDDYFVEDLQATNFTKLDGQRLPAHAREKIEDGARLDFGRVAVIFRRS